MNGNGKVHRKLLYRNLMIFLNRKLNKIELNKIEMSDQIFNLKKIMSDFFFEFLES